jgi:hypothetical protein
MRPTLEFVMEVFLGTALAAGTALATRASARTSPSQMPTCSRVRRLLVAVMLGATGSFALACGAFAGHRSYAPAPVVRLASRPMTRRL